MNCPKCSTPMLPGKIVAMIPAINNAEHQPPKISSESGLPVQYQHCPKCEYVELYHYQEKAES
jgi:hypothetical protein